ncbi:MAG TPA: vWA domain-containing protein, partial [Acidimicrobiales bacterium]|nr:vWA domain-containing protein [Acidimicrobiales bacterium]
MTQFEAQAFQNEYLPAGGTEVHAIVTVRASGAGSSPASGPPAVVVVVDVSGSMNNPRHKIREAKKATQEAIQCVRDGSLFAIVAGSEGAQQVYPPTYGLVAASNATRDEARKAVGRLAASGGTAIGSWLTHARFLFASAPASVRHAIVLTDGRNEDETPDELATAVKSCEGV